MLDIKNISKTFNPGTVNEKRALTDLTSPSHRSISAAALSGGCFRTRSAAPRRT